jgi:hypothetical protein
MLNQNKAELLKAPELIKLCIKEQCKINDEETIGQVMNMMLSLVKKDIFITPPQTIEHQYLKIAQELTRTVVHDSWGSVGNYKVKHLGIRHDHQLFILVESKTTTTDNETNEAIRKLVENYEKENGLQRNYL